MALAIAITILWFIFWWYIGHRFLCASSEGGSGSAPTTTGVDAILLGIVLPMAFLCTLPSLFPLSAPYLFGKSWVAAAFALGKPQ